MLWVRFVCFHFNKFNQQFVLLNEYLRVSNNYYTTQFDFFFIFIFVAPFFSCVSFFFGRPFTRFVYFVSWIYTNKTINICPSRWNNIRAFYIIFISFSFFPSLVHFLFICSFSFLFSFDSDGFGNEDAKVIFVHESADRLAVQITYNLLECMSLCEFKDNPNNQFRVAL